MNRPADFQLASAMRHDESRPWKSLLSFPLHEDLDAEVPILLLSYHRDRLASASDAFGWTEAATKLREDTTCELILSLAQAVIEKERARENGGTSGEAAYKIRPVVSRDGRMELTVAPVPSRNFDIIAASALTPSQIPSWLASLPAEHSTPISVLLDSAPTPRSPFTSHKTTIREPYTAARQRLKIETNSPPSEVILYNEDGEITEGSLRNIAFWRGGGWVTPPSRSGGIRGTIRRWMIEQNRVREKVVRVDELSQGEWVLLSNGVEGCSIGRFTTV